MTEATTCVIGTQIKRRPSALHTGAGSKLSATGGGCPLESGGHTLNSPAPSLALFVVGVPLRSLQCNEALDLLIGRLVHHLPFIGGHWWAIVTGQSMSAPRVPLMGRSIGVITPGGASHT